MDESTIKTALQRLLHPEQAEREMAHDIYHEDAVLEFPQSQERFEGKANFLAWRTIYPADVEFKIRRISGQGNFWVTETAVRYNGGVWNYGCSIHEFRGAKIARETIYYGEGWEAPEWRAPWRAVWQDEPMD